MVQDHRSFRMDVRHSCRRIRENSDHCGWLLGNLTISATMQSSSQNPSRCSLAARLVVLSLLSLGGCQSVVDPGRSMRPAQMPTTPGAAGPQVVPHTVPSGPTAVEKQPASAVLQLPQANTKEAIYHKVKSGDSWSGVARQYRLTVPELTDANGIDPSTALQPGQMIYIPEKSQ